MLSTLKGKSFAAGLLTAVALWSLWWIFFTPHFTGGHVEDSPSGKYTLSIFAPMDETIAGTYVVTLNDKVTGNTLRSTTVKLNSKERTKSLRGCPISMIWDATESTADITIDGKFLVRISVPAVSP